MGPGVHNYRVVQDYMLKYCVILDWSRITGVIWDQMHVITVISVSSAMARILSKDDT